MSAHLGEDYKPLKPSDTIKELSDMCFGGEQVEICQPVRILANLGELETWLDENPDMKARVIPTVQNGDGEYVMATDHAAELAEALDHLSILYVPNGPYGETQRRKAFAALTKYRQSRGE